MRTVFYFVLCLVLASATSFAQDVKLAKNGLPYNAKVITITSDLEGAKLFEHVAAVLFDNNYEMKYSDKDAGALRTDNKNVKGGWFLRLSISISGNTAKVRGNIFVRNMIDDELENYGMKGSLNLLAFNEMNRVAELISHKEITYSPTTIK